MTKSSKRHTDNKDLVDAEKRYDLEEAITILKDATNAKFEESIDVAINPVSYTHLTLPTPPYV